MRSRNDNSTSAERRRPEPMDIPSGPDRCNLFSWLGIEGREETIRQGAGTGSYSDQIARPAGGDFAPPRKVGKMTMVMTHIVRTTREWWLIFAIGVLFVLTIFPITGIEVYPVIDTLGSNMTSMETKDKVYHCGDVVVARFTFQKQRAISGVIQWKLVADKPGGSVVLYPPRTASSPPGITDHYAPVETLPPVCEPGRYHFEGSLNYPLLLGRVSYPLRTQCFEVREGKK
jgi:hypothetical protein